jgi:hypothetical protein
MIRWLAPLLVAVSVFHLLFLGPKALTPTVSLIELEWTSWAAIGMAYSSWFLFDVLWGDLRAVRASGRNGRRAKTVELYVFIGIFMFGVHGLLFSIGAISMARPQPLQIPSGDVAIQTALVVFGQILVLTLVRINQIRRQLREMT